MADNDNFEPRNGLGTAALALGVLAVVLMFVPIVGVFAAAPCALLALLAGLLGLMRVEERIATNKVVALSGGLLGLALTIVAVVTIAASIGPTNFG